MKNDHVTMRPRSEKQLSDFISAYKCARNRYKIPARQALHYARAIAAPIFYN